jgi:multimeric flavodoxin WrbA
MKIACVSASNIEVARKNSASTRVCELIREIITVHAKTADVEIIALVNYKLKPCRMCGKCLNTGKCTHDEAFNQVYAKLLEADGIYIVCPHYAPIPSKMMILLEKFEEMAFLQSTNPPERKFGLAHKSVGVIAHGGQKQSEEALGYYKTALLDPLSNALGSVGMKVIGVDEKWPNGVTFGIKSIDKPEDSIFVTIDHDWADIRERIGPLVYKVLDNIAP